MPPRVGIHEAARRAQILQAVRTCIVALGYERVTVRDVAKTAGVSTGTIVHYFGDKDTMLEEALLAKVQDTGIAFRAALTGAQTCAGYLDHPFRKMGSLETLLEETCLFLRIDTLLLRSLTLIQYVYLL